VRLFVSIDLPEKAQLDLASWIPGLPGLRKTDPEQIHLTLFFLGECSEAEKDEIVDLLDEIPFEPFGIKIRGTGTFPNKEKPRVIWAGVEKSDSLMKLQKTIQDAVKRFNPEAASRSYTPHITLARVKGRFNPKHQPDIFDADESISFRVHHFSLKKSIIKPEGSVHEIIKIFR